MVAPTAPAVPANVPAAASPASQPATPATPVQAPQPAVIATPMSGLIYPRHYAFLRRFPRVSRWFDERFAPPLTG
jgi:hypothetical protein